MQMVERLVIYSPERKTIVTYGTIWVLQVTSFELFNIESNNLLTLFADDPPPSRPEWNPLCLFSWFPHLCWVPTDSFY
jgi:hypothetical protein